MIRDADRIAIEGMRREGVTFRAIAARTGYSRGLCAKVCRDAKIVLETERAVTVHKQRVDSYEDMERRRVDLWPTVPWHLRITERGHSQYGPERVGG